MKVRICASLFLAALTLISCEQYDTPTGRARVTRINHNPANSWLALENPVVSQKQPVAKKAAPATPAPVAAPLPEPEKPEVKAPEPTPAPEVKKPEPSPIVSQQQPQPAVKKPVPATPAPVAAPLPEPAKPVVKAPAPAPKPEVKKPAPRTIVSQQQPTPRPAAQPATYYAPNNASRLPLAPKRSYPLMPGQNRGLKARVR